MHNSALLQALIRPDHHRLIRPLKSRRNRPLQRERKQLQRLARTAQLQRLAHKAPPWPRPTHTSGSKTTTRSPPDHNRSAGAANASRSPHSAIAASNALEACTSSSLIAPNCSYASCAMLTVAVRRTAVTDTPPMLSLGGIMPCPISGALVVQPVLVRWAPICRLQPATAPA
ncbi:hypothetical protein SAMN05216268_13441 [Streptomyces yunnanensis]|uniref:Uncharacterized protein n=1 Tax=Streptomyces yunnanensis TaxID=156453 RepID=A0A9X8N930_9ACTN|nr:hypothetical protein SAMN05216268_13441 [Streptomyces yunnanensis]